MVRRECGFDGGVCDHVKTLLHVGVVVVMISYVYRRSRRCCRRCARSPKKHISRRNHFTGMGVDTIEVASAVVVLVSSIQTVSSISTNSSINSCCCCRVGVSNRGDRSTHSTATTTHPYHTAAVAAGLVYPENTKIRRCRRPTRTWAK